MKVKGRASAGWEGGSMIVDENSYTWMKLTKKKSKPQVVLIYETSVQKNTQITACIQNSYLFSEYGGTCL